MFTHYLASAWRHFRQHTATTLINVFCLTFGLVAFLLAWGRAEFFARADHYHERADRTVILTRFQPDGLFTFHLTPWTLAPYLHSDVPEIETLARASYPQEAAITADGRGHFASTTFADGSFLEIFDIPLIAGDARKALAQPRSVIVSEALARRLFGTADVLGRTLRFSGQTDEAAITGVIGAIPQPSHLALGDASSVGLDFTFEAMFTMDMDNARHQLGDWEGGSYFTYAVLSRGGADAIAQFDRALLEFSLQRVPTELQDEMLYGARAIAEFTSIGLDMVARSDVTGVGSSTVVKLLGALVLAIACLNYANLATALAMTRAKELALRKVVGASRRQLVWQHLIEGGVLTLLSFLIALLVVALLLLAIDVQTLRTTAALLLPLPHFWLLISSTLLIVTLVASAYPALALSRVRPALALRGGKTGGAPRALAMILVGCQFAASSFLMISVFVLLQHYRDTRQAIANSATDPLLAIANDLHSAKVDPRLLKSELQRLPSVKAVTMINRMPWSPGGDTEAIAVSTEAGAITTPVRRSVVDTSFFTTMNIRLLAGRTFEAARASDSSNMKAWYERDSAAAIDFNIVMEANFLPRLNLTDSAAAIDRIVYRPTSADGSKPAQRLRIIGVVEPGDFTPITVGSPGMYFMNEQVAVVPIVRVDKGDVAGAIKGIDRVWHELAPEVPIKRRFADEQFDLGFQAFARLNSSMTLLAMFACAIAVVGLIGMALHSTRRRLHEIGVRKTLGASAPQIVRMLLQNFLKPVVIANVIVWPLVYALMSAYLSIFANRGSLTLTPFIGSLLVSMVIACIAVGAQTLQAARLRPADVLRYE
jgi:putative ABC transport system permease protein